METRVWIQKWTESSLNDDTYKGYIESTEHVLVTSVDKSDELIRILTEDGKNIIFRATDIIQAAKKIML